MLKRIKNRISEYLIKFPNKKISKWKVYKSKKLNLQLLLNADNYIDYIIINKDIYGAHILEAIDRIIKKEEVSSFYDIGANIGIMSLYVKKKYSEINVVAFEPVDFNFTTLEANKMINELGFTTQKLAVSNENTLLTLYLPSTRLADDFGKYNAGMPSIHSSSNRQIPVQVNSIKFDDYIMQNEKPISGVNLIKIDVEGSELKVLEGMEEFLKREGKIYIIIELLFTAYEDSLKTVELLTDKGFTMHDISLTTIRSYDNLLDGDYIFVKLK